MQRKQYFEFKDGSSAKFWEITLHEQNLSTRFGKIGTAGQTSAKKFASAAAAQTEFDKLLREKSKKGYQEVGSAKKNVLAVAKKPAEPKRPSKVPKEAEFNVAYNEWELGKKNTKGERIGEWKQWHATSGHLTCMSTFTNGGRTEVFTRFHPDGTYSWKGTQVNGVTVPGQVIYWQKSKHKTTESPLPLTEPDNPEFRHVFRVEQTFIRKGLSTWKNFNAKGQRIDMYGEVFLDIETNSKNFAGLKVPEELARLLDFQTEYGIENYSQQFGLTAKDKYESCQSWSKNKSFLQALSLIGVANGTGSEYYFWNIGKAKSLSDVPVVIFGDEGGVHVVAENLRGLLQLLSYDCDPSVGFEGVSFYRTKDEDPSAEIKPFRKWLKDNFKIDTVKNPKPIVEKARAKYQAGFDKWMGNYCKKHNG
jgi:predicted DNA-binding WGR domain protein